MKRNFLDYLDPSNEAAFLDHFNLFCIRMFALHGMQVQLATTARDIWKTWRSQAASWSLNIPTKDEVDCRVQRTEEDPKALSAIKQAGILLDAIHRNQPISSFSKLNIEQTALLLDCKIAIGDKDSTLLERYPHEFTAIAFTDFVFDQFQIARTDKEGFKWQTVNPCKHYRENRCMLMHCNLLNAEAHYMTFKTRDLYGWSPE